MKRNAEAESDNWGQMLSDFGIEDSGIEDSTPAEEPVEVPDPMAEVVEPSPEPKEKKSFFSRFPKVDFFGAPPEVSVDSVIEGVKSPSLGGKTFTDNKLEKMPVPKEWTDRQEEKREKSIAPPPEALSAVAAQIDALASGTDSLMKTGGMKSGGTKAGGAKPEERPARRQVSSMFDDPVPESEEARKLKNIMGESPCRGEHRREVPRRDEPRRDTFRDDESDSWQRGGRGRGRQKPQPVDEEVRGRGSRYRPPVEVDDLPETVFEPIEDDVPPTQERGRRGSRYAGNDYRDRDRSRDRDREPIRDEPPQEEWSEVDAALQGRGAPAQRGGRRPRSEKRREPARTDYPERSSFDREPLDMEDSGVVAAHWNVPSWDEAIGDIVAANIARHKSHSGRGRR